MMRIYALFISTFVLIQKRSKKSSTDDIRHIRAHAVIGLLQG
jgi:hypothetical protein